MNDSNTATHYIKKGSLMHDYIKGKKIFIRINPYI